MSRTFDDVVVGASDGGVRTQINITRLLLESSISFLYM